MSNQTNAVAVGVMGSAVRGLEKFALTPSKPVDAVDVLDGDSMSQLLESAKGFISGEKDVVAGQNRIMSAGVEVRSVLEQCKPLTYAWFETVRKQWGEYYMKSTGFNQVACDTAWSRFMPVIGIEKPKAGGKAKEVAEKREAEAKRLQAIADLDKAMAVAVKSKDHKEVASLAKEAERRGKVAESGAVAELKPLKDQIRTALTACNNKHTLQLVLGKLQGKKVNLQEKSK